MGRCGQYSTVLPACHGFPAGSRTRTAKRLRAWRPGAPCFQEDQQQVLLLQPQPFPQPPQLLPLPQQHQMMISRMMIQQQLPPPKPLLHIQGTSYEMLTV